MFRCPLNPSSRQHKKCKRHNETVAHSAKYYTIGSASNLPEIERYTKMRVLEKYDAELEDEISVLRGDIVTFLERDLAHGDWSFVELGRVRAGFVPTRILSKYHEEVDSETTIPKKMPPSIHNYHHRQHFSPPPPSSATLTHHHHNHNHHNHNSHQAHNSSHLSNNSDDQQHTYQNQNSFNSFSSPNSSSSLCNNNITGQQLQHSQQSNNRHHHVSSYMMQNGQDQNHSNCKNQNIFFNGPNNSNMARSMHALNHNDVAFSRHNNNNQFSPNIIESNVNITTNSIHHNNSTTQQHSQRGHKIPYNHNYLGHSHLVNGNRDLSGHHSSGHRSNSLGHSDSHSHHHQYHNHQMNDRINFEASKRNSLDSHDDHSHLIQGQIRSQIRHQSQLIQARDLERAHNLDLDLARSRNINRDEFERARSRSRNFDFDGDIESTHERDHDRYHLTSISINGGGARYSNIHDDPLNGELNHSRSFHRLNHHDQLDEHEHFDQYNQQIERNLDRHHLGDRSSEHYHDHIMERMHTHEKHVDVESSLTSHRLQSQRRQHQMIRQHHTLGSRSTHQYQDYPKQNQNLSHQLRHHHLSQNNFGKTLPIMASSNSAASSSSHTHFHAHTNDENFYRAPLGSYLVLFDYNACSENDIDVYAGEVITVLNKDDPDWLWVARSNSKEGFVPAIYMCPYETLRDVNQATATKGESSTERHRISSPHRTSSLLSLEHGLAAAGSTSAGSAASGSAEQHHHHQDDNGLDHLYINEPTQGKSQLHNSNSSKLINRRTYYERDRYSDRERLSDLYDLNNGTVFDGNHRVLLDFEPSLSPRANSLLTNGFSSLQNPIVALHVDNDIISSTIDNFDADNSLSYKKINVNSTKTVLSAFNKKSNGISEINDNNNCSSGSTSPSPPPAQTQASSSTNSHVQDRLSTSQDANIYQNQIISVPNKNTVDKH